MAEVFHYDLYGLRAAKYQFLLENTLSSVPWQKLKAQPPQYFFAAKNFENKAEYERGFSVPEIFPANSVGIVTARDEIFINDSTEMLLQKIENYFHIQADKKCVKNIAYRPFDNKLIYYDADKLERPRKKVMRHFLPGNNIGLVTCRQSATNNWTLVNITNHIVDDSYVSNRTKERGYIFPLYLYPFDDSNERRPNLNMEIVNALAKITGLSFTSEKQEDENTFAPIDLLDYIYAVLYSNNYRAKYREFLKIDFPRVPCPENAEQFQKQASIGSLLRGLHLMKNVNPIMGIADFPVAGTNEIETVNYKDEKVFINKKQYFETVPPELWSYHIGGYQPAEKWLKDRKGRALSFEDIEHYQKIISVLKMTVELQAQIDEVMA